MNHSALVVGAAGLVALGYTGLMMAHRRPPLRAAAGVDLARYLGAWRVIACTDNPVEREFTDAVETYSQDNTGKIHVHLRWHDRALNGPQKTYDFTGQVADATGARWKMRLLPPFRAEYVILEVDRDYQWAIVGHPSRKFGWLLARQKRLADAIWQHAMRIFRVNGYDLTIFPAGPTIGILVAKSPDATGSGWGRKGKKEGWTCGFPLRGGEERSRISALTLKNL